MNNTSLENKIDEIYDAIKNKAPRIGAWDYHKTYHTACVAKVNVYGLWLEFGVYRGRSINTIAKQIAHPIYGFDSFEGLPEHWDHYNPKGVFSLAGHIPAGAICGSNDDNPGMYDSSPTITTEPWEENVILIKGWFNETLPFFLNDHKEKVAFVHIDSDIYSAANTIITSLEEGGRFQNGTLLLFDEICDYTHYREHEIKAFAEFLLRTNYDYECLYHQGSEANRIPTDAPTYSQACFRILIPD